MNDKLTMFADIGRDIVDGWVAQAMRECEAELQRFGVAPEALCRAAWARNIEEVSLFWLQQFRRWARRLRAGESVKEVMPEVGAPGVNLKARLAHRQRRVFQRLAAHEVMLDRAMETVGALPDEPLLAKHIDHLAAWLEVVRIGMPKELVFPEWGDMWQRSPEEEIVLKDWRASVARRCYEAGVTLEGASAAVGGTPWDRLSARQLDRLEWLLEIIADGEISRQHAIPDPLALWLEWLVVDVGVPAGRVAAFLGLDTVFAARWEHVPELYRRAARIKAGEPVDRAFPVEGATQENVERLVWTDAPRGYYDALQRLEKEL